MKKSRMQRSHHWASHYKEKIEFACGITEVVVLVVVAIISIVNSLKLTKQHKRGEEIQQSFEIAYNGLLTVFFGISVFTSIAAFNVANWTSKRTHGPPPFRHTMSNE
jgi:hypothetical protein